MRLSLPFVATLSLSVVVTAGSTRLRAQLPALGNWLPPYTFAGPFQGCSGSSELLQAIHASVIPVGPKRGKVLLWDRSSALSCSLYNGALSGDRDQRWAILDPEARTIQYFSWTIPAAFAPPVYQTNPAVPNITHGAQGLFCSGHCWLLGGSKNPAHAGPMGGTGDAVKAPEVYRGGAAWEFCMEESSPREYHSGALLLPSGRVVSLGGETRTSDSQVFEPHYLTGSTARPVIASVPQTIGYASSGMPSFSVTFTLASPRTLQSACLVAPGSVTHAHDPNQRLVELDIQSSTATTATLATPPNPTYAPFGHYMLFLVDSAGEVSVAAWTQLL